MSEETVDAYLKRDGITYSGGAAEPGCAMARQLRSVAVVMLFAILFVDGVGYLTTQRQHGRSRMPTQHFGIRLSRIP